jgi:Holliday junction DNA helicase RuvA
MIGRLTGAMLECKPDHTVVDVGGVGYHVRIPLSTYYALCRSGDGARVSLHIHTHVREDTLQLFGFSTEAERTMFEQLLGISGIGPRVALAVLSGIGVDELVDSVERQDRARLQKIPGVGKKTAERVLLELSDRIRKAAGLGQPPAGADRLDAAGGPPQLPGSVMREEAVSALVNLGYTRDVADRSVERALRASEQPLSLESLLRAVLGGLSG